VVAILGILAAVIIPNVAGFMVTGKLNAANTELENVKTAGLAYFAEFTSWPTTAENVTKLEGSFISGKIKAHYYFDDTGFIVAKPSDPTPATDAWGLNWRPGVTASSHGAWIR
jgi:type IV pilus assembly protein PilA